MIALDTNVLVYAHRGDSPVHVRAVEVVRGVAEGEHGEWGLPWPCVHEFLATVTRSLWTTPTPVDVAMASIRGLVASPWCVVLGEGDDHLDRLDMLLGPATMGPKVHDARIAAICLSHRVQSLWTADRDFGSFPDLVTHNPLVGPAADR